MSHSRVFRRAGFTLVELLVVIAIIAILIGILLPTLNGARKSADKAKCLSALRSIGQAYQMYANDNKGAWPVSVHFYVGPSGDHRDKRWHDFIAKYLIGAQTVTDPATGTKYTQKEMNFNGSCSVTTVGVPSYATHGEFGTVEDPIWIGTMRDRNSVLWGCPSWNRVSLNGGLIDAGANNGYAMSFFPLSPNDEDGSIYGVTPAKKAQIVADSYAGNPQPGNYFKFTQWKKPADRALVYDAIHVGYWNSASINKGWIFKPEFSGAGAQDLPKFPTTEFPADYNRHAKGKPGSVVASDAALNMLYCDGHAATVSAREGYRAIRFH